MRARSEAMKALQLDELIIGNKEGPHLRLESNAIEAFDRNGTRRFRVLMEGGRYPTLELCDGNGTARIIATVMENGSPFLTFRDGNFTARAELAMDEDDVDVSLILCDRNDNRIFDLGEDHEGNVQLRRVDEHGNMVPWVPTTDKAMKEGA
jgi:hypothetical protein